MKCVKYCCVRQTEAETEIARRDRWLSEDKGLEDPHGREGHERRRSRPMMPRDHCMCEQSSRVEVRRQVR